MQAYLLKRTSHVQSRVKDRGEEKVAAGTGVVTRRGANDIPTGVGGENLQTEGGAKWRKLGRLGPRRVEARPTTRVSSCTEKTQRLMVFGQKWR
jgi:hypothetical protein